MIKKLLRGEENRTEVISHLRDEPSPAEERSARHRVARGLHRRRAGAEGEDHPQDRRESSSKSLSQSR